MYSMICLDSIVAHDNREVIQVSYLDTITLMKNQKRRVLYNYTLFYKILQSDQPQSNTKPTLPTVA